MTAALNVSALDIGRVLWQQPMLVKTIAPNADEILGETLEVLRKLGNAGIPTGWSQANVESFWSARGIWTFVGWLIMAFATLFGRSAPFWFDALEQIVRLKGSGAESRRKALWLRGRGLTLLSIAIRQWAARVSERRGVPLGVAAVGR